MVIPLIGQANPLVGKSLYVYPESSAAVAVRTQQAAGTDTTAIQKIADTPTAIWLVPEKYPTNEIAGFVDGVASAAAADNKIATFVIYGIPNRDCNNLSAGGLSEADYPAWISAIAAGLANHESVVIVEPDALTLTQSCGDVDKRTAQIKDDVDKLSAPSVLLSAPETTIYLDGGHSNWITPAAMADLLNKAGISKVRGFATNVSNFNTTADEHAYGEAVSKLTGGAHYVIDTGRNGNGSNGEWCNPAGRALGEAPGIVSDGAQDANLWIKNPGESDGACNGAPAAGAWWNDGALALANASK
ncbi:glycoside hydrolase family 6 protein [Glaciihabitans sp. dw_435]|uniref:glycoside hydrolase family 6 protein n=1 Tax=Glaciihabitans sp. dw_435 TaxID=2720081 RepID=UPI001BD48475|nr:glycoside hydrolase family 6 protein [Glaciihabitans sp. dw_435]